jgi:hypothetical protein
VYATLEKYKCIILLLRVHHILEVICWVVLAKCNLKMVCFFYISVSVKSLEVTLCLIFNVKEHFCLILL